MRFLCLSGMGTNAQILDLQLSAITSKLPAQHQFTYINGDVGSDPGQGIGGIFSGPYFSFWDIPTSDQLDAGLALIEDVIDEEGPFDIILGYSQGAAMAATYLIQDARSASPRNRFKGAIFINANMPFDPISRTFRPSAGKFVWTDDRRPVDFDVSLEYPEVKHPYYGTLPAFTSEADICQRFQPSTDPLLMLPTLHIIGDADDLYRSQAHHLTQLCDLTHRNLIEYRGDHSIPKDFINTSKIVRSIESFLHSILVG